MSCGCRGKMTPLPFQQCLSALIATKTVRPVVDILPVPPLDHLTYMRYALSMTRKAPSKPTNISIGAVVVDEATNTILSTGYTIKLSSNIYTEHIPSRRQLRCRLRRIQSHRLRLFQIPRDNSEPISRKGLRRP